MRLDEKANQTVKDNRSVKYEKPIKTDSHAAEYHYPSGNGSVSPIQKMGDSLIDQPGGTREYHYPSGPGDISPIRRQSKYIVGGRMERMRNKMELNDSVKAGIVLKAKQTRIETELPTATGERRDFNRGFNSDKDNVGSIANSGKQPKVYNRFIRPVERLSNQKIDEPTGGVDGKREYHYPSGSGKETRTGKYVDPSGGRGYDYPSGPGNTSPIVGKVISGKSGRR